MIKRFMVKHNLWTLSLVFLFAVGAVAFLSSPRIVSGAASNSENVSGLAATASHPAKQDGTVEIIVKFKASATSAAADAAIRGVGGNTTRNLPQLHSRVVSIPASAGAQVLAALSKHPSVERAATAIPVTNAGAPDDPGYSQQWALPKIAWDQAYGTVPITGSA